MQLGFSVSNRQKVQLNTNLLKRGTQAFIHNTNASLKLNEIKSIKVWLKVKLNGGGNFNLQTVGENSSRKFLGLSPNVVFSLGDSPVSEFEVLKLLPNDAAEGRPTRASSPAGSSDIPPGNLSQWCKTSFPKSPTQNKLERLTLTSLLRYLKARARDFIKFSRKKFNDIEMLLNFFTAGRIFIIS
jgi:hypothetical protein